ncbi:hypothetical protein WDW89_25820 [Deltaproteobacteria bacterium TL4]
MKAIVSWLLVALSLNCSVMAQGVETTENPAKAGSSQVQQVDNTQGLTQSEEGNQIEQIFDDPEFRLQLIKAFGLATLVGFLIMLVAGMTNKVVIYYDGSDFFLSFMTFGSWIIGAILIAYFDTEGQEGQSTLQTIIFYATCASSALCAIVTLKSSIQHNRNVVLGIVVGLFKIVSSALGILVIIAQIATFFSDESSLKDMIWAYLIFGLFIWIGKKLINGEQVYIAKGWALPGEEAEIAPQQA